MADAKVVFLHGLPPEVVEVITSYTPDGFTTVLVEGSRTPEEQMAAVEDADFLMVYRARLTEQVLRAAKNVRLVQLLAAGYDSMDLPLMRELEVPCANNGGANS